MTKKRDGWYRAFAPASIANFGSGFDAFAAAIAELVPHRGGKAGASGRGRAGTTGASGTADAMGDARAAGMRPMGDRVFVRRAKRPGVRILSITGDGGRLPRTASKNCAAAAALAVLRRSRAPFGLELVLEKGLPLSSGLGSSAASAAAGAYAAALAVSGGTVVKTDLLECALAGEHLADGAWHGDNVWASLLGGGVIVVSTRPARAVPIGASSNLSWVAVHPAVEIDTRRGRSVLPRTVPLADATGQAGRFGSFIAAWMRGDRPGIGLGLEDRIAEPRRARLLPGFAAARRAALGAGAFGMTFAGSGPSVLALTPEGHEERVGRAIRKAFAGAGLDSRIILCAVDSAGARPLRAGDEP